MKTSSSPGSVRSHVRSGACETARWLARAPLRRRRSRAAWCRRRRPAARPACSRSSPARIARSGPVTDQVVRPDVLDHFAHRAVREQLAVGDVGEPVAALRFVHVVRGDEEGQALAPRAGESAPRNRGAPSGPRPRSARRAAAASARESGTRRARAAASSRRRAGPRVGSAALGQPEALDARLHAPLAVGHAVHARDEIEILARCSGLRRS